MNRFVLVMAGLTAAAYALAQTLEAPENGLVVTNIEAHEAAGDAANSAPDPAAGRLSYRLHCIQCHGEDGDAVSYPNTVPLAGIHRRHPPEQIGRMSGAFSGRTLQGKDRADLVSYLGALRGTKGFPDPGWLVSPVLLEMKSPRIHEFRVLDVRPASEYTAGHVPNAIRADPGNCLAPAADTTRWMGELGITPSTIVVIYDQVGGPSAACAWWRIRRAGHPWAAVLDGGWRRWAAEGRFVDTTVPRIAAVRGSTPPSSTSVVRLAPDAGTVLWNWRAAVRDDGFLPYAGLRSLLTETGIATGAALRWTGTSAELAHLALAVHLLGLDFRFDAAASAIAVAAPTSPGSGTSSPP